MPPDSVMTTQQATPSPAPQGRQNLVVVGGGAGGLELARKLGRKFGRTHTVTLVDCNRTHVWKPLLHEVAAGSLDANQDELGYRTHCHRWGVNYFYGAMEAIDRAARRVIIAPLHDDRGTEIVGRHTIPYDYLVIAIGSITNDFGTEGAREHCVFLDDRAAADRFRNSLLNHCARVAREVLKDPQSPATVNIAIVGGGATGVELAAELFSAATALKQYGLDVFDEKRLKVTLIEAGPRILPALPDKLAAAARSELEKIGVRVLAATPVTRVAEDGVVTQTGEIIPAELKVWAAGVRGPALLDHLDGLETNRVSQLTVRPTLQTVSDDRIFAIGDCCSCTLPGASRPIPPRAQAAHQMADTACANIARLLEGRPLKPFTYKDYGSLVSLSRFSTVGSLMGNLVGGAMAIEGRLARFAYTSLYRMHLIAIHGWLKGLALIAVGQVNAIVKPRMKLH